MPYLAVVLFASHLAFAAPPPEINWTAEQGWLTARVSDGLLLGPSPGCAVEITVDDKTLPDKALKPELQSSQGSIDVVYALAAGRLTDRYEAFPALGKHAWLRTITYRNLSASPQDVTSAKMSVTPQLRKGGAKWTPQFFWMGETSPGMSVCISYRGSTDYYHIETGTDGRVTHVIDACWRLKPGEEAAIGQQGIWIGGGGQEGFREEARRWFDAIDLHVPDTMPAWLNDTILYELNAGGHIDSRFSDVGGFDNLAKQVDYLADLGVTAVWLQGVEEHKTPPDPVHGGWNLYDPRDFTKIDSILGGPEALKRLTDKFRARDIHVLGELVPHGGKSVQAMALKDWRTYKRDAAPQQNWGGCGMDYSSPAWQKVMHDAAAMLARDFGMEGVRIDCADASGPNWKSPKTNHTSYSTLAGSVEMLQAIRDGMNNGKDMPVLIPESLNTLEHFAVTPVAYGFSTTNLFARELPLIKDDPVAMVSKLRDFFECERGSYPPGARVLRTLGNHDTVCETGRVQYRYGAGLARALYGVCLMAPGIPMMYQEDEVGSFEALGKLNQARRNVPEFSTGDADYLSIRFAPQVFACLRRDNGSYALGLANLSGKSIKGNVVLPPYVDLPRDAQAYDAVSGRVQEIMHNQFPCELGPYETALIRCRRGIIPRLQDTTEPAPPSKPAVLAIDLEERSFNITAAGMHAEFEMGSGPWKQRQAGDATECESASGTIMISRHDNRYVFKAILDPHAAAVVPRLRVYDAARWYVSGRTALLEDRAMRRHFPFGANGTFPPETRYTWDRTMSWISVPLYNGVAPTERLWQSVLEPLHPKNAALAFQDASEATLVVSSIVSTARNIILADGADTGNGEKYGLSLEFHGRDADLNRDVAWAGLGQPWILDTPPPVGKQELSFTLSLTSDPAKALEAVRMPVDRGEAHFSSTGGQVKHDASSTWFVEPATATWSNLAPISGHYRIQFELRHSESSANGTDLDNKYEIAVDGKTVPIEWTKRNTFHTANAYFGYAVTPLLDLALSPHTISIKTLKTWCAARGGFRLMPEK